MGANSAAMVAILAAQEQMRQTARRAARARRRRQSGERGECRMNNSMLSALVGRECMMTLGSMGAVKGRILRVEDNWLEVETKKGSQLVNADYISHIQERE